MRIKLMIVAVIVLFTACKQERKESDSIQTSSEKVTEVTKTFGINTYNYDGLAPLINKKGDKTYIVNFWATWCKPCVDELPYFEKINQEYKDKNVEVLLVSLDFPNEVEKELLPFLKDHNITSEVVLFDDPNQNEWINKINPTWSGSLPATIIYNKNSRKFYEKPFEYEELESELNQFLN
ncbi:TlpA disulfide reductase family protein [Tenacibaculum geojense]|uniref:TlpA disulfide reductase family protein n=1 Tax=Tenacibaculum geojense TaxID=915352 RepID=A0ABW3JXJ2_9FLAO